MYNTRQYDAAKDFVTTGDANVTAAWDILRIQAYDLYENIYRNATFALQITLRGEDQAPIIVPNGKKLIEATGRFLGVNIDYLVEAMGDEGAQQEVDAWWADFWKREAFNSKFSSNKRWGLVRGDSIFYVYARPDKVQGKRICIKEIDPRQVFEIEDEEYDCVGVHIVDLVHDFRQPDKPDKQIARRRTFRKLPEGADNEDDAKVTGISSELTFWEIGKWDDRTPLLKQKQVQVPYPGKDEPVYMLPSTITQLPTYKWRNAPPQNSSWGTSQLAGLETLLYAINQSLSDEDATLVFQGLGMYVTNAAPPIDPNTGEVTDWNIGPKQIIEISGDQTFNRITGVSDITPFTNHMSYIDDHMSEASGTPQVAIGRVDVAVAESGISLQLQMMPLIAANAEKELEWINVLDQMFHDITTMWLPGYESEQFGNVDIMSQLSVVCVFDDPMPKNRDAQVQEVVLLDASNLILKSMVVGKLRELGWKYPTVDANGQPLTDDDIAAMLLDQSSAIAQASDPFAAQSQGMTTGFDQFGNPIQNGQPVPGGDPNITNGQVQPNTPPDQTTVSLGTT